jgi:SMI1-KNR4 cell-wall
MPFDPLLFFADAGNGDQFAFLWKPRRDEIFVWDHESDSRSWVAGSLHQYLQWWLDGTLRI